MMKLSRRGIFGAAAGAAIAGPSMAKEAAARMGNRPPGGIAIGQDASCKLSGEDPNWFPSERARLEKHARGEFDDDDNPYARLQEGVGDPGFDRIDALRSVSAPIRRIMANDLARQRQREGRMRIAAWELRDLLKRYAWKL